MRAKSKTAAVGKFIRTALFWLGVISIPIVPPISYWCTRDLAFAGLWITCITIFCFFLRFEDIQELPIGGLRAKMRETIQEAIATTEQLRQIAVATGRVALTDLAAGNFFDGMPTLLRFRLFRELYDALKETGASTEELRHAAEEWHKATAFVYAREIRTLIDEANPNNKKLTTMLDGLGNFEKWEAPKSSEIRALCAAEKVALNDTVARLLEDFEKFERTHEIPDDEFLTAVIRKKLPPNP